MLSPDGIAGVRVSIGPDPQPGQMPDDFPASFLQSPELVVRDAYGDVPLMADDTSSDVPQEFVVVSDEQTAVEIAIDMGALWHA